MKSKPNLLISILLMAAVILVAWGCGGGKSESTEFVIEEATIAQIHAAFQAKELTSRQLTEYYLKRIEAYDQPLKLNAIVVVNPNALKRAKELDEEFKKTKKLRPLHGIPIIVKDNYETHDLQTTAGSAALKGFLPPDDAFQVKAIREAGAIVLAKSNMAEWAFSPFQTESSTAGTTVNPYDLTRVPAGSSGGTAAAVAANFGTVGLGTDTGNSIRGPSSHNCLVGIRSTLGLTSRDGIIPLYLRNDVGGPMARTVEDAVRILEVIAGNDPADPLTKNSFGQVPESYTQYLRDDGLSWARLGVLRILSDTPTTDPEIKALFERAIQDLKDQGAFIVDPFEIPGFDELRKDLWCDTFRYDINQYLASLGEKAPVKNLAEIIASGLYSPYIEKRLQDAMKIEVPPGQQEPPCLGVYEDPRRIKFREAILSAMAHHGVDAIILPTWNNPPRKVGDNDSPHGNNSPQIPPHTGQPAFTVPMGFTPANLPAGLQFIGKPFEESMLIKLAYAYEQATQHRRAPVKFPALGQD